VAEDFYQKLRKPFPLSTLSIIDTFQKSQNENIPDVIKCDIPLFIRLLEYAREDAKTDMNLHDVTERLLQMTLNGKTATMKDYDKIVKE